MIFSEDKRPSRANGPSVRLSPMSGLRKPQPKKRNKLWPETKTVPLDAGYGAALSENAVELQSRPTRQAGADAP